MLASKAASRRRLEFAAGDNVVVLAGRDRGKQGEVLRTIPAQGKVVVKGINIVKRHVKSGERQGRASNIQGGIVDFEAPLDASNLMLVCPHCHRPTRIRHTVMENGQRAIECTHCGNPYERVRRQEAQ